VQKVVSVDTATPHFDDPTVQFVAVPGTGDREGALVVRGSSGTTLILNDIVGNIRDAHGVGGWLLRVAGFAGDEPRVPKVVQKAMVEDKQALRQQLLQWSGLDGLARILVSHGEPIEGNAREALRTLAQSLD
jgi:hypothetical protein